MSCQPLLNIVVFVYESVEVPYIEQKWCFDTYGSLALLPLTVSLIQNVCLNTVIFFLAQHFNFGFFSNGENKTLYG